MIYTAHQPHYLPHPGYLEKVSAAEVFVFLEKVQYLRREYQNRNRIKGPDGAQWLTVPVKGEYGSVINEMTPDNDSGWQNKHVETLRRFYSKAEYYDELDPFVDLINGQYSSLSDLTVPTTRYFIDRFGIDTEIRQQEEFDNLPDDPNFRIIEIGKRLGADIYLSGVAGKNYLDIDAFSEAGIKVTFQEYTPNGYPQLHGDFIPFLGSIDLLLNTGPEGFSRHIKHAHLTVPGGTV